MIVDCPTVTPRTSVIAFSGPGVPSNGTPRSRARGLPPPASAATRIATRNIWPAKNTEDPEDRTRSSEICLPIVAATTVGIFGFGRIGRNLFRLLHEREDIRIGAVADLAEPEGVAYLLRFDTLLGRFPDA